MTLPIKRITAHPPETFIESAPFNLVAGDNKITEYVVDPSYLYMLNGFSFPATNLLRFTANVDQRTGWETMTDIGAAKGLDYEEDIKFPAAKLATLGMYTAAPVANFQWRHKVTVFKPNTALKIQLDRPLSSRDRELDAKFDITRQLNESNPAPYDIYDGIEKYRTQTVRLTATGNILTLRVPTDEKYILTNISATRPVAAARGAVTVMRDDIETVLNLDLFCLASLAFNAPIRIIALEKMEVDFALTIAGTYPIRVTYGIGKRTLLDKVRWGLDLDTSERTRAEELDLFDKVDAGLM